MRPVRVAEVIYPHVYLWESAQALKEQAARGEAAQPRYLLAALLMAYLAFEAFINFLGEALCPELWADERGSFRGQGEMIEAKIGAVVRCLPGYTWRKGQWPYQEVKRLKRFRDLAAHGKVSRTEYETWIRDDKFEPKWEYAWDAFLEPAAAERSMRALREFAESLRVEAETVAEGEDQLVCTAFEGPPAWAEAQGLEPPPRRSR